MDTKLIIGIVIAAVVIFFIVRGIVANRSANRMVSNFGADDKITNSTNVRFSSDVYYVGDEEDDDRDMTDKWLEENNLCDDTYETLLENYFGFDAEITIESLTVNHDDQKVIVTFTVPKTEEVLTVELGFDNAEFSIVDSDEDPATVLITFDGNISSDSPDYDCTIELPIAQMNWDLVVGDICDIAIGLTQKQYDKVFPTITL